MIKILIVSLSLLSLISCAIVETFTFTTPGMFYAVSSNLKGSISGQNPTLTFIRGNTYELNINAASTHPLYISQTTQGCTGSASTVTSRYEQDCPTCFSNSSVLPSANTKVDFTPDKVGTFFYICAVHCFFGTINVIEANTTASPTNSSTTVISPTTMSPTVITTTSAPTNGNLTNGCPNMTDLDSMCRQSMQAFSGLGGTVDLMPGAGLPSQNEGVCTLMISLWPAANTSNNSSSTTSTPSAGGNMFENISRVTLNGIESKSILLRSGMFSSECYEGKWLNLFEIQLADKKNGTIGAFGLVDKYVQDISRSGLEIAGVHFHFFGVEPFLIAVHHQSTAISPVLFAQKTNQALKDYRSLFLGNLTNNGSA